MDSWLVQDSPSQLIIEAIQRPLVWTYLVSTDHNRFRQIFRDHWDIWYDQWMDREVPENSIVLADNRTHRVSWVAPFYFLSYLRICIIVDFAWPSPVLWSADISTRSHSAGQYSNADRQLLLVANSIIHENSIFSIVAVWLYHAYRLSESQYAFSAIVG
jgi:hypothetical protein